MIYSLIILMFGLMILGFICSDQNILAPSVITSGVWLICLSLFLLLRHNLPMYSIQLVGSLALWSIGVTLSSLLVQSTRFQVMDSHASVTMRDIYLLVSVLTFPLLLWWAYNAIKSGLTDSWTMNLRLSAIGRGPDQELYDPVYLLIWEVSYGLELMYFDKKKWWRCALPALFFLSYAFFTMSKAYILAFFCFTVTLLLFKHKIKIWHLILGVVGILILFVLLQSLRESYVMDDSDKNDFLVLYLLSSMSAFDVLQAHCVHWGENVFRVFYAIAFKLGISDIEPVNPLLPFIHHPIVTNTYTGMYPFFVDFGYWGVGIFAWIAGGIYGFVFRAVQLGSKYALLLYAYFVHIILMQYVADMFFTNIAGLIKFTLIALLPFFIEKYQLLYKR